MFLCPHIGLVDEVRLGPMRNGEATDSKKKSFYVWSHAQSPSFTPSPSTWQVNATLTRTDNPFFGRKEKKTYFPNTPWSKYLQFENDKPEILPKAAVFDLSVREISFIFLPTPTKKLVSLMNTPCTLQENQRHVLP
jgi:hypothetical protein